MSNNKDEISRNRLELYEQAVTLIRNALLSEESIESKEVGARLGTQLYELNLTKHELTELLEATVSKFIYDYNVDDEEDPEIYSEVNIDSYKRSAEDE